jgi:hypothetical protein
MATQSLARLSHAHWIGWLIGVLITLLPLSLVFTIFYRSHWRQEWPAFKRVLFLMLVSCIVFCAALLMTGFMITIGLNYTIILKGH